MQALSSVFDGIDYYPIWNEVTGTCQVISGLYHRQVGNFQKDMFGNCHPREFEIKQMRREGKEELEEGLEKLRKTAVIVSVFTLAFYF